MRRRDLLKAMAGAAAVVVGFDAAERRWVARAHDAGTGCGDLAGAPRPTAGTLLLDEGAREAARTDKGNMVYRSPCAVLRTSSVGDIAAMVAYCRRHGIPVSARGQAHTTFGQGLSPGLVIETEPLDRITIADGRATVGAGVLWRDLIKAAYAAGFVPPTVTGYTALSVGGTLSVGGVGGIAGSTKGGAQVDSVRQLEVVTGAGDVVTCSMTQHRDLFEVVLAGLGQCGVITSVTLDLVPARQRARTYSFHYLDNAPFFADLRKLLDRGGFDQVYGQWLPPGVSSVVDPVRLPAGTTSFVYHLEATVFYDVLRPPNDLALISGLSTVPVVQDQTYLDYIFFVDRVIDTFRATVGWDRLVKPWFDVWLPDSAIEDYVGDVVPALTPRDVGATGFVLLFPTKRSRLTRPFLRVPEGDGNGWVYLFDVLTSSALPGPDPAFATEMLGRNDRLFDAARPLGGVRYPIGALTFDQDDWKQHYGSRWPDLVARKRRYDPGGILTPGPGIFG